MPEHAEEQGGYECRRQRLRHPGGEDGGDFGHEWTEAILRL
jgi:hypothetical protein